MKVLSEKRMELSQTIASLTSSIRMKKGCKRCDFCLSIEDENRLFLLEEWDTQENLMIHLQSEHFKVLRGAMNLLKEPYEMIVLQRRIDEGIMAGRLTRVQGREFQ
jgi:quinol monooxygenase YgiN